MLCPNYILDCVVASISKIIVLFSEVWTVRNIRIIYYGESSMIIKFEDHCDVFALNEKVPFNQFCLNKGTDVVYKEISYNYVVFVVSGSATIRGNKNQDISMSENNMYALSKLCAPYNVTVHEDMTCVVLVADALANHVNATHLMEILESGRRECDGVPGLPYGVVMQSFVQNILMLNSCTETMSSELYNVKKVEYLHYMRMMYNEDELVHFMYGILSTYSTFKMGVYSNFSNSINVEMLAESLYMTVKTFTRRFKQEFNMTPHDWILEQKLYNINNSIINKGMPVSSLMEEFGFASVSALRQFCKRYDIEHLLDFIRDEKAG